MSMEGEAFRFMQAEFGASLPAHLSRIVEAEYSRFSQAEMARRCAAIETMPLL